MNRFGAFLAFLAAILLVVTACSSGTTTAPAPSSAALGQKFELAPGQSQSIAGEDLSFKFIAVTADSRCPLGVQCIQAGQAKCQLEVTLKGQVSPLELVETGLTQGMTSAEMGLYRIAFQVTPYPEAGKQINAADYRLGITVTKSG